MAKRRMKNAGIRKEKEKSNKSIAKLIEKNKKVVIASSIIILLFLSFGAYRIWLNIHFFITDDLNLILEPQDMSLSVHYDEKPNVTFKATIENSIFCNAYCSYKFRDLSSESIEGKGAFTSKGAGKSFKKDFQLEAGRTGSGQKIYSFDIECSNIRTWYCLTDETKRQRSAFITLNYDISEYEQFLKAALKENITKIVAELSAIDIELQKLNNKFFELGFNVNLNEIEADKEILNNNYNVIILEFENLETVWSEEDYLLLSELFNKSYGLRVSIIKQEISRINSKIDNIVITHNSIVEELSKIDDRLRSINETAIFLNRLGILERHKQLLNDIKELKLQIQQNIFTGYSFFGLQLKSISNSLEIFEEDAKNSFINAYLQGSYYLNLEKEKLCSIKGACLNKTDFLSAITDSQTIDDNKISNICGSIEAIENTYEEENNKSKELLKNYNLNEIQEVMENAQSKKTAIIKRDMFNEIKNIAASNKTTNALSILSDLSRTDLNFSEEIGYGRFSEREILSLIQLNLSNNTAKYDNDYCKLKNALNIQEYYGNKTLLNKISYTDSANFSSRIDITLVENYPVCCVFGECRKCCTEEKCREDPSLYPVLFLHGHSFNKDNSPDFSLDAFNKIQAKLQEDGYTSAGTITPISDYSEIKRGEWGLSSKPISAKGSYYLVSYYSLGSYSIASQTSESIETYAIRLKELIDLLKFRTGRDKVNIIAHSMGGLTARSYMQIFGENSVNKLIMIAAPNKGVFGQVSSYCPVLGEKKECNDMNKDSIFIKKLNDPLKIPKHAKIYNIIGVGCSMDNKDGDGIVLKENAVLDYAENYYINGTCQRLKLLHTELLDIDKYPELYDKISYILKN